MRATLTLTAVALLAVALIALIAACGGSNGSDDAATSAGTDEAAEHFEGDEHVDDEGVGDMHMDDEGDELLITMRAEGMKFDLGTVSIKVGQTVRLRLENHDPIIHDYTTDEAEFIVLEASGAHHDHGDEMATDEMATHDDDHEGDPAAQVSLQPLHIAAEANDHGELVFEATEPGEYVFYCSVPGHREAGMEGKIIIEE